MSDLFMTMVVIAVEDEERLKFAGAKKKELGTGARETSKT